ncbi:MAG TPA: polyketide synthase, partial [Thermomicrobiales bacterium]|nr:polyketide synthase [Thermomicrobiales bacterium]
MSSESGGSLSPLKRAYLAIEQLEARLQNVEQAQRPPIAIVGAGLRFPGGANDPESFWRLLSTGTDTIGPVPAERWDVDALYDPDPDVPGKISSRFGAFISDVDQFDPLLFGISPREADRIDPQQRLLLETAWEALERAGIAADRLEGSATGVFVGMATSDYALLQREAFGVEGFDQYYASGFAHSIAAGRLSYVLGLQGPSIAVDTACSSSLVAVHLAVQSLRSGECDLALAGGVNLMLSSETSIALSRLHMLATDGRCKAFDEAADGFVRGEGCGVVALKRLADAMADGDPIMAVIRGSAVNQDGRSSGLTAPNGPSQEAVIRSALADAGLAPGAVQYVEAHGTGTSLGDPIEARALGAVLGQRGESGPLLVGSVKTNLGHLEAAAGVAGLLKVALMLQHGQIPPSLHFQTPSPHIPWSELPLRVPSEIEPWPGNADVRVAGVSSFGFSGTNAHLVLESAPTMVSQAPELERPVHLLPLSAHSPAAVDDLVERYTGMLRSQPQLSLADVAATAGQNRAHHSERLAIVADTAQMAIDRLSAVRTGADAPGVLRGRAGSEPPAVVF